MKDPQQPPVRRGLPLGWHLILSAALIIAVVMGGISVSQQLADMRKERATHQALLRLSLVPLAARMEGAGSLQQMRDLVKEFHGAHLDFGDAEHNVVLIDSAGVRVLSTLPPDAPLGNRDFFRASLPFNSPFVAGGQGTLLVLKSAEEYRAGVRREWLLWLVHLVSTVAAVSLVLGVATYLQVTKPVNRLIRGVRKMERGYWGPVDPGGAWEIRWLAWRFANMAREVRSSANRLMRAERKAWSSMAESAGRNASNGAPSQTQTKNVGQDWASSSVYKRLEALCERLEAASPGDAAADELARAVPGIHAQEADRLGLHDLKARMEDAALKLLEPEAFALLTERLDELRATWGRWVQRQRGVMVEALEQRGIPCAGILHRVKHTAGVRLKMRGKDLDLDEVYDLFAFRIIVPTEADCYAALGVIHQLYEAEVSRFKDYIAEPKDNGYQALHTCVQSEGAPLFEVQIRSLAMDQQAERGMAVHWQYKASQNALQPEPNTWGRWIGWWRRVGSAVFRRR